MVDVFTKAKRSDIMSRIRSHGNKLTELAIVRLFREQNISGWRRGVIIRIGETAKQLAIKPDFVFRKHKIAMFVDGEFWHGHPTRAKIPQTNSEFWIKKIAGNKARDRLQNQLLQNAGWTVVRIWQRDIKSVRWLKTLRLEMRKTRRVPIKS